MVNDLPSSTSSRRKPSWAPYLLLVLLGLPVLTLVLGVAMLVLLSHTHGAELVAAEIVTVVVALVAAGSVLNSLACLQALPALGRGCLVLGGLVVASACTVGVAYGTVLGLAALLCPGSQGCWG
jgi:hypothetical protein